MSYSELILRDSADIVWPLDDISPTSSISAPINFFYKNQYSYSASINVNNTDILDVPMVFGGGKSLLFTASAVGLSIPALDRFSEIYQGKNSTLSFWIKINQFSPEEQPIMKKRGDNVTGVYLKDNNIIFRYGTSASYNETAGSLAEISEPHHIFIGFNPSSMYLSVDGIKQEILLQNFYSLPKDPSHSDNNYFDFYGPKTGNWSVDSIAIYPNIISSDLIKRHYVYGLGKSVGNDVFYARGGTLHNFSLIETNRLLDINWRYPEEWWFAEYKDLSLESKGLRSLNTESPTLFSFDNKIIKNNNSLSFATDEGRTLCSYIEVKTLFNKLESGSRPFFVKVKLDGTLPEQYLSQRIMTYGEIPDQENITFDLYNNAGNYQIKISSPRTTNSVYFDINNISASPDIYIGMKFLNSSLFYFSQTGSAVQTASFSYVDSEGYGIDPAVTFFPPKIDSIIRIGSSLRYDLSTTINYTPNDPYQFSGTFKKFFVGQEEDDSFNSFTDLDSYRKFRYGFYYDTYVNRFKVQTYGHGYFNVHGIEMGEYVDDTTKILGANVVDIGYPTSLSSSQVYIYATLMDYSGSVIYPKTEIDTLEYLPFINNINLDQYYLRFDIDIYSEDRIFYPATIEYFRFQTFKSNSGKVIIKDSAAEDYILYPSGSTVYLPELRSTPTIFLKDNSGIKVLESMADLSPSIVPEPLDPRSINNLVLWLDADKPQGLAYNKLDDDVRLINWVDNSEFLNHAISFTSSTAPIYRIQSLNIFKMNQLNGAEGNDLSNIETNSASVSSTFVGVVSGNSGIEVIPDGTDTDSYIYMSNTASISVFPNQQYTVVGTIKMNKPQTASALNQYARSIVVYTSSSAGSNLVTFVSASNTASIQSLSATFTTDSATYDAEVKFYNGSFSQEDPVYWDNLGLYLVSASPITSWQDPLSGNDSPTVKFNGKSMTLQSSASSIQPFSIYFSARSINDNVIVSSSPTNFSIYTSSGVLFVDAGVSASFTILNNNSNVVAVSVESGSATLYLNGNSYGPNPVGHNSISNVQLGRGVLNSQNSYFSGDISSVILYKESHSESVVKSISNLLYESFGTSVEILPE